jgi:hypothetical protein
MSSTTSAVEIEVPISSTEKETVPISKKDVIEIEPIKIGFGYLVVNREGAIAANAMKDNIENSYKQLLPQLFNSMSEETQGKYKNSTGETKYGNKIGEELRKKLILELIPIRQNELVEVKEVQSEKSLYNPTSWFGKRGAEPEEESVIQNSTDSQFPSEEVVEEEDEDLPSFMTEDSVDDNPIKKPKDVEKYDLVYWFIDNEKLISAHGDEIKTYSVPSKFSDSNVLINVRKEPVSYWRRKTGYGDGNNYKESTSGKNLNIGGDAKQKHYTDYWCEKTGDKDITNCSKSINEKNVLTVLRKALLNMVVSKEKTGGWKLTRGQKAMIGLIVTSFAGLGYCYLSNGSGQGCIDFLRQGASDIFNALFGEGSIVNTVGNFLWEKLLAPIGSAVSTLSEFAFDETFKGAVVLLLQMYGINVTVATGIAIVNSLRNSFKKQDAEEQENGRPPLLQWLIAKATLAYADVKQTLSDRDANRTRLYLSIPGIGDMLFSIMLYMIGGPWYIAANMAQKHLVDIVNAGVGYEKKDWSEASLKTKIQTIVSSISVGTPETINLVIYSLLAMPLYAKRYFELRETDLERVQLFNKQDRGMRQRFKDAVTMADKTIIGTVRDVTLEKNFLAIAMFYVRMIQMETGRMIQRRLRQ